MWPRPAATTGSHRRPSTSGIAAIASEGVDGLRDRSRRPLCSPEATNVEVVGKVIYLRQNYHFGPTEDLDVPEALPRRRALELLGCGASSIAWT